MKRRAAEVLVAETIRQRVFDGDDRELPLDATLAEVGFDSLALVSVVSGLEEASGRGFPDEYWEDRQTLRVRDLVDAVERFSGPPADLPASAIGAQFGASNRARSPLGSVARALTRWVFSRLDVILIERVLDDGLPQPMPPPGIVLREATTDDAQALALLWPRVVRGRKTRQFRRWLREGYVALAAFDGDEAVALDWLHHSDPQGGVAAAPGTCLGIDLRERTDQADRGIGLALLAQSLQVARAAGYARQAAYVARNNLRMRTACTGLLGFAEFGSARRTTTLGKTRWTWTADGATESSSVLRL